MLEWMQKLEYKKEYKKIISKILHNPNTPSIQSSFGCIKYTSLL